MTVHNGSSTEAVQLKLDKKNKKHDKLLKLYRNHYALVDIRIHQLRIGDDNFFPSNRQVYLRQYEITPNEVSKYTDEAFAEAGLIKKTPAGVELMFDGIDAMEALGGAAGLLKHLLKNMQTFETHLPTTYWGGKTGEAPWSIAGGQYHVTEEVARKAKRLMCDCRNEIVALLEDLSNKGPICVNHTFFLLFNDID